MSKIKKKSSVPGMFVYLFVYWFICEIQHRKAEGAKRPRPFFAFRQKSLFIAGRTSIGCQKNKQKFSCTRDVYLFICVIQHRNWPLRSTMLNAHGTNASPDGLCTRTHTNVAFSCWFCCARQARKRVFIKPRHALLPISLSGNSKTVWVLI